MKKILKNFILFQLFLLPLFSIRALAAHSQKTYLPTRPQGQNSSLEQVIWHGPFSKDEPDLLGIKIQQATFYQTSSNSTDMGAFLGVKNSNTIQFDSNRATQNVAGTYLIHDAAIAAGANQNLGTVALHPSQKIFGCRLDYFQHLDRMIKNFYLHFSIPIVFVDNKINLFVEGPYANTIKQYFRGDLAVEATGEGTPPGFLNLGYGGFGSPAPGNGGQEALINAKIDKNIQKIGVADLDLFLGFKILRRRNNKSVINLIFTVPTGNKPTGSYLFEPIIGNGNHFAFGLGMRTTQQLFNKNKHLISLHGSGDIRYLIKTIQRRTATLKNLPFSQYYLLGEIGQERYLTRFSPAANILARNMEVEPKFTIDATTSLAYKKGIFNLEIGYNLFMKCKESVKLKDKWFDGHFGLLHPEQTLGAPVLAPGHFGLTLPDPQIPEPNPDTDGGAIKVINQSDIDLQSAIAPQIVTHKIYASIGTFVDNKISPLMVCAGLAKEIAHSNLMSSWQFWTKIGFDF